MIEIMSHIVATIISGCIVSLFAHWLRKRDKTKK